MAIIQERISAKGKTSYRVLVRLKGHLAQSAMFDRKTDAKKWAQDTESAIRNDRHFKTTEAKKHTLDELVDRYIDNEFPKKSKITQKKQPIQLLWWKELIGERLLTDVTPALIAEHRDKLYKTPIKSGGQRSQASVNRYLAAISHALTVAVNEWGWLEESPMRKVKKLKEPEARLRFLSDDERTQLLQECMQSANKFLYTVAGIRKPKLNFANRGRRLWNAQKSKISVFMTFAIAPPHISLWTAQQKPRSPKR